MPLSGKCRRNLASHLHTKIVEDCAAPLSNTLHLPDGTVIERGMFRLRNLDLVDILQARAALAK